MKSQTQKKVALDRMHHLEAQLLRTYEQLEKWQITLDATNDEEHAAIGEIADIMCKLEKASMLIGNARIRTQNIY